MACRAVVFCLRLPKLMLRTRARELKKIERRMVRVS